MQGRHLSFPKAYGPPPAAYVYNVQSVTPPSRKKEPLPASENGRGMRKGDGSIALSKARIQIKKNIIIIII